MAKTAKRKRKATDDVDAAQLVRIQAKQRLQRALRFERQIQNLTRQLVRALQRSDDMLIELARELMRRVTEADLDRIAGEHDETATPATV
jgi:predicted GIY-YIG superfamily endonuclease